ncbi:hypothetical protein A8C46_00255 [Ligilactobacillus salivarius]|uniref:glutaredoxin domain-containing protein n=1 Tax=Ligilactobacillus salivarius TaxID=1624 RepID=UPI000BD4B6E9|nr:glutaredoxin domain-containing protein [Ligilactobacillus salivarius]PAY43605.1 hypothetical protein A8C39_00565 [Ligilactobacillus salivarius]PAY58035.1 hypothetical protein A8C46_00255 [Ligilactobacillus salivarius]PAY61873.1 hypothetical protein A8C47_01255 [Ligilactobacillus salivarius]PAY63551.1 hypothetical protein A8C48_03290 [Ligilactobacillus salivarius]
MTTVSSSNVVTVYSKNNCQQCKITKRKLHSMGIDYHEYNVDEDPKALDYLLERGLRSLSVVVTEDDTWTGLRMDKLNNLQKKMKIS